MAVDQLSDSRWRVDVELRFRMMPRPRLCERLRAAPFLVEHSPAKPVAGSVTAPMASSRRAKYE